MTQAYSQFQGFSSTFGVFSAKNQKINKIAKPLEYYKVYRN